MPLRASAMCGACGVNSSSHVSAASVVSEKDSAASPARWRQTLRVQGSKTLDANPEAGMQRLEAGLAFPLTASTYSYQ